VVVPGNHDVPLYRIFERVFSPLGKYRRHISPELDTVLAVDGAVIVALNTTEPLLGITNGRIRPRQLDLCGRAFADAPAGAAKIVVAHHHFAPAPDYDHENDVMWNARRALDRFARLEVDLIMGGHLHRTYIGNSLDVYPTNDRTQGVIIAQCGTSTSRRGRAREREKNSFLLVRIDSDRVHISQFMYFHAIDAFAPTSRHVYPRRHSPWLSDAPAPGSDLA
jgi:3',5'-cyclic AMP phosphodiesterase CpdA